MGTPTPSQAPALLKVVVATLVHAAGAAAAPNTLEQRVALLKADFYAERFGKHFVQCRKCQKEIRLDKRSEYYPGSPPISRSRSRIVFS
ncbi:hypothetical protein R3P38DRAFT_2873613 [Favolaschia claudopus]|uniref:Uncharacterized protein n=1 Tax=Favolaschia claudopus TaxID=2862362 RepID=A0AAW0D5N6_9AGAR